VGRKFDVEYDDFSGGHFVGPLEAKQPANTFVGSGVTVTPDEGFLMPDGGWTRSSAAFTNAGSLAAAVPFVSGAVVVAGVNDGVGSSRICTISTTNGVTYNGALTPTPATDPVGLNRGGLAAVSGVTYNTFLRNGGVYLIDDVGATSFTPAVTTLCPSGASGFWQWGAWSLSIDRNNNQNRLYYSQPGNPLLWGANNFIDIGPAWSRILTIVTTADQIIVASTDGWYTVSGVLGQTNTTRKVSRVAMPSSDPIYSNAMGALEMESGIASVAGDGDTLRMLQGSRVDSAMFLPAGVSLTYMANVGEFMLAVDSTGVAWVYSESQRRWRKSAMPTAAAEGVFSIVWLPARDEATATPTLNMVAIHRATSSGSSARTVYAYRQTKDPLQPEVTASGVFPSATVTLADHSSRNPFRVTELLVEVDFGQPATQTSTRSLTVDIVTGARADLDPTLARTLTGSPAAPSSSAFTTQWSNMNATIAGDRQMVRCRPNDAGAAFSAAPRLVMQGVKVRRVIMRCEEI
jgi:hypothetical protein